MPRPAPPLTAEALLAHGAWLRRLAAYLLGQDTGAGDAVQETWEAALRSPPDPGRPLKPWLAEVLRNVIRMDRRAAYRRSAQQSHAEAEPPDAADEALARLRLQAEIAQLLTELEEPYRTTLILRFHEGHDAAEIARRDGIPAGTVRWRVSEGVRRLRARLDERHGQRQWSAVLAPLAARRRRPRLFPLAAGACAMSLVGATLLLGPMRRQSPAVPVDSPAAIQTEPTKEGTMNAKHRLVTFLGVALPALLAAAPAPAFDGRPVTLDFHDAQIRNVLRLLANAGQVNIWANDGVKGQVNVKVKDIPWDEALDRICREQGLHWQRNDNVILVSPTPLPPARAYQGKRIDIDFVRDGKPVDVRVATAALAAAGDVKIEVADEVQVTLSMKGRDMPWDQALDVILWAKGLRAERRGDVIRVLPGR